MKDTHVHDTYTWIHLFDQLIISNAQRPPDFWGPAKKRHIGKGLLLQIADSSPLKLCMQLSAQVSQKHFVTIWNVNLLSSEPVQGSVHQHYWPLPSPMSSKKVSQTFGSCNPCAPICPRCQTDTVLGHQDGQQLLLWWQMVLCQELYQNLSKLHQDLFQLQPLHPESHPHLK